MATKSQNPLQIRLDGSLSIAKAVRAKRLQLDELAKIRSGGGLDKEGNDRLAQLEKGYAADIARLLVEKEELRKLLTYVSNPDHRAILELRYGLGLNWEAVADATYFSLVHMYRLAKAGVAQLSRTLDLIGWDFILAGGAARHDQH